MAQTLAQPAGQNMLLATFFVRDALCALDASGIQEAIRLGPVTPVNIHRAIPDFEAQERGIK